jgi:hypothetical protein
MMRRGSVTTEATEAAGTILVVEPLAGEQSEQNFTPVGRLTSAMSVLAWTPSAVVGGGTGLGAPVFETNLRALFEAAGFAHVRRVTETPLHRVLEVRR